MAGVDIYAIKEGVPEEWSVLPRRIGSTSRYLEKIKAIKKGKRIYLSFGFSKKLREAVKDLEGRKWHGFDDPPLKMWSIPVTARNWFNVNYITGGNPFERYDQELVTIKPKRECLMDHQVEMFRFCMTRRYGILACEMGTGKTLAAIEVMEAMGLKDHEAWYVGPRSGVRAVSRELIKWRTGLKPRMMTYNRLVQVMKTWNPEAPAPKCVILDESSKVKNPTAQRTQASKHLADAIREEHGDQGMVILMTGSPSPKAPTDWFAQADIACPGFLKEANINKLKTRLCLMEEREGASGVFPYVVTWFDDDKKCKKCGRYKNEHDAFSDHAFVPSTNEVLKLEKRLRGLVLIKYKKDCLDLPEKSYELIRIKPTMDMIRAAKLIKSTAPTVVGGLIQLRELSDGFQYKMRKDPDTQVTCKACDGSGVISAPKIEDEVLERTTYGEPIFSDTMIDIDCPNCKGRGTVDREYRTTYETHTPKDDALIDILEEHEEVGRVVIWAGFNGSVERLVKLLTQKDWSILTVTGAGYKAYTRHVDGASSDEFLSAMDLSDPNFKELKKKYPRLAVVGNPDAGGMALTFTAAPTAIYYSNSFNGESRIQSEDRIHRTGMDKNRGAKIIDLVCLPSDQLVIDNLKAKKRLQNMTMGELDDAWARLEQEIRYE